jgi:2-amino-4-hydroxy-6-hydroxymethyldihydropteridine diphosphokinase
MARKVRSYVGLGANVGDARKTLAAAVRALRSLPGVRVRDVSDLYLTRPVGVTDQADFLNAAVALDVPAGPDPATGALALLLALKQLERAFGRTPSRRWGPRALDLDLLVYGGNRIRAERPKAGRSDAPGRGDIQWLEVPHPSARERLFVLEPLADVAPRLVPPGWHETVGSARDRRRLVEGEDAVQEAGRWTGENWA